MAPLDPMSTLFAVDIGRVVASEGGLIGWSWAGTSVRVAGCSSMQSPLAWGL